MRLFCVFSTLGLLLGTHASTLDSRSPAPHPLDKRALVDVCASLDVELKVPGLLGIGIPLGILDACLCLSALPHFLETNIIAIAGVAIVGKTALAKILTNLIVGAAPKARSRFPDHSSPACVDNSPCGFSCIDGFMPLPASHPTTCVCKAPSVICNGICGPAKACPTSKPVAKRWLGSGSCTEMGPGWDACGVFGGGARAWECVNTARDLESCGGCVVPLTAYSAIGQDCTVLPGVADVGCVAGGCAVRRCLSGYAVGPGGSRCVPTRSAIPQPPMGSDVPAHAFNGLEHALPKA